MDAEKSIPLFSAPSDRLRVGVRSLENESIARHQVESQQKNVERAWVSKLDNVRRMYGSALAMRLAAEKKIHSEPHRLPGLKSSRIALDTLMGTDSSIDFTDFLDDASMRPQMPKFKVHEVLEAKLGL